MYQMPILGFARLAFSLALLLFWSRHTTTHTVQGEEIDMFLVGKDPLPSSLNPDIPQAWTPPEWILEAFQRTMLSLLAGFLLSTLTLPSKDEAFRKLLPPSQRRSNLKNQRLVAHVTLSIYPITICFVLLLLSFDLLVAKTTKDERSSSIVYIAMLLSLIPFFIRITSYKKIRKYYCTPFNIGVWAMALLASLKVVVEAKLTAATLLLAAATTCLLLVFLKMLAALRQSLGPEAISYKTQYFSKMTNTRVNINIFPLAHAMIYSSATLVFFAFLGIRVLFYFGNVIIFKDATVFSLAYILSLLLFSLVMAVRGYCAFFFLRQVCYLLESGTHVAFLNQMSLTFILIGIINWFFTAFWYQLPWFTFGQTNATIIASCILILNFMCNNDNKANLKIFKTRDTKSTSALENLPEVTRVGLALPFWLIGTFCCKLASWISPRQVKFLVFEVADIPNVIHGVSYNLVPNPDEEPKIFYVNVGYLENSTKNDKWLSDSRDTGSTTLEILEEFAQDPEYCKKIGLIGSVVNEYDIPAHMSRSGKPEIKQWNLSAWRSVEAAHDWARGNEPHKGIVKRYHGQGLQTFSAMISGWKPSSTVKYNVRCRKCKRMVYNYPKERVCKHCNIPVVRMSLF